MADLIQLLIKLSGDQEVYKSLDKINALKTELQKSKINLSIDKNQDIEKEIARVRQEIHDLQELSKQGLLSNADKQHLKDLQSELDQLRINAAQSSAEIGEITNGINAATSVQKDLNAEVRQQIEAERAAAEEAARMEERFKALLGTINGIATAISGVASIIDSVNGFGQGIWNIIGDAGSMFSSSIIDKALDTVVSNITSKTLGNLNSAIERYDILHTFSPYMQLMGISQTDADTALSRINESILGLPIGLDEAAYRLRRYQMFIGDIEKSTDFTIGIQRAILAGGANQSMQNQAYYEIERLLTTGSLSTKRQWMSLLNGLGVSTQFVAEQLGYSGWTGKELAGALYSGTISAEEFLHAIEELGVGTSEAAQRLNAALEIQKGTIESWISNIDFAFTRGNANAINALNTMLTVETGVSITGYMEAFRNKVNEAYAEIQEWIYTHPESFEVTFDALDSLGESLSGFNLGQVATDALNHSAKFIDGIAGAVNKLDPDRTQSFVAFAASVAKPISQIAMKSGDFGVAMGVIEEFDDHDWGKIFEKIVDNVNDIADIVSGMLNVLPDEMLDGILAFSVTKGPLIVGGLNLIAKALKNVGGALEFIHNYPVLGSITSILATIGASLGISRLIEMYAEAAGHEAMDELYDIDLLTGGSGQSQDLLSAISKRQNLFSNAMSSIDTQSGRMQSSLDKIRELNKAAAEGDSEALLSLSANVDRYNALFPEFALTLDSTTGLLDKNSSAIARNAEAYAQAYEKTEKSSLLTSRLAEIDEDIEAAQAQFKKQQELAAVAAGYLDSQSSDGFFASESGLKYLYSDLTYLAEQYDDANTKAAELKTKVADLNAERAEVMADLMYTYLGPDAAVKYRAAYGALSSKPEVGPQLHDAKERLDQTMYMVRYYAQKIQPFLDDQRYGKSALALTWDDVSTLREMHLGPAFEADLDALIGYKEQLPELNTIYTELYTKQSRYNEAAEDAKTVVEELTASLYDELAAANSANEAQDEATVQAEKVAAAAAIQKEAVDSLVESYNTLKQSSYDALHSALAAFEEIKPPEKEYDFTSAITNNAKLTEEYYNATLGFAQELLNLTSGGIDVATLPEGVTVEDLVTFINDIRATGDMYKLTQAWNQYQSGGLAGLAGLYNQSLANAADASELNAFLDALQSDKVSTLLAIFSGDIAIPEGLTAPFIDSLEALSQLYDQLVQYGYEPDKGFLRMLNPKQEEDAYSTLEEFQRGLEDLFGIDEGSDEDTVNGILGTVNRIMQETIEEKMPGLVDALHNSEKPIKDYNKSIETTADNQDDAAQNTDKHKNAVNDLENAISGAMETFQSVKSVYADIASEARGAAGAVVELANAIAGVPSLSIPSGLEHNLGAVFGDSVYRASGGPIFGSYNGTDNVPAMLMPGEFVIRRGSAQALGRSFLENINRLNIPGAIDALMKQALPLPGHFVAYNNSRSYDNHAQVIQNINTNNAAFTYRRASRFVGAL